MSSITLYFLVRLTDSNYTPLRYFILWLRSYTEHYNEGGNPEELEMDAKRAIQTFFDPRNPLALNLSHDITHPLLKKTESGYPPVVFDAARKHVRDLLEASLQTFVRRCCGNAQTNRSWFSVSLATFTVVLGILVVLGSVFLGWARAVRFAAYPLFILGFTGIFAGLHGRKLLLS